MCAARLRTRPGPIWWRGARRDLACCLWRGPARTRGGNHTPAHFATTSLAASGEGGLLAAVVVSFPSCAPLVRASVKRAEVRVPTAPRVAYLVA